MLEMFGSTPSLVQDPFKINCIETISIRCDRNIFTKGHQFRGYVAFKKGETEARQNFEANNLGELYMKVYEFCKTLESV